MEVFTVSYVTPVYLCNFSLYHFPHWLTVLSYIYLISAPCQFSVLLQGFVHRLAYVPGMPFSLIITWLSTLRYTDLSLQVTSIKKSDLTTHPTIHIPLHPCILIHYKAVNAISYLFLSLSLQYNLLIGKNLGILFTTVSPGPTGKLIRYLMSK